MAVGRTFQPQYKTYGKSLNKFCCHSNMPGGIQFFWPVSQWIYTCMCWMFSLFNSNHSMQLICECEEKAKRYSCTCIMSCIPKPNTLPLEELLYSKEILLSLQSKSSYALLSRDVAGNVWQTRLTVLTRITALCLKDDYRQRPTVNQLLEDSFLNFVP